MHSTKKTALFLNVNTVYIVTTALYKVEAENVENTWFFYMDNTEYVSRRGSLDESKISQLRLIFSISHRKKINWNLTTYYVTSLFNNAVSY
jgi:hypothetical protein